jgi:FkbM family methyltransferase
MKALAKSIYRVLPFKKQVFKLVKRIWTPDYSIYRHLVFWDKFTVQVKDKKFLLNHFGFYVENEIFWKGLTESNFEKTSMKLWIELSQQAYCVMDIGANTGVYALVAKTLNPEARVIAFEPLNRTFTKLMHNVISNRYGVECEEIALSDSDGEDYIYDPATEHNFLATLNPEVAKNSHLERKTKISKARLDTYIRENDINRIDLMKIDVEGHEPNVLLGMGAYLEQMRPAMLIEITSEAMAEKIESIVKGLGYLYFNIDEKDNVVQMPKLTKSDYYNYLLCSPETAMQLKLI